MRKIKQDAVKCVENAAAYSARRHILYAFKVRSPRIYLRNRKVWFVISNKVWYNSCIEMLTRPCLLGGCAVFA